MIVLRHERGALGAEPVSPLAGTVIYERSAGKCPDSIEVPNFVKPLTGWLGKYQERADRKCQNDVERRELFELADNLLGACMGWHSAGFPVVGEGP